MNLRREYELNTGYSIDYELQGVGNLKYVQWLEKELAASRDSRTLSAVPSDTDDAIAFIAENGRIVSAKSGTSQAYKEMIIDKCRNYMRIFSPKERGIAG